MSSITLIALAAMASSQQIAVATFRFENTTPAFEREQGPSVCIDEAHHNFHTLEGRYAPFGTLLRDDGYRVAPFNESFDAEALARCDVLVIANALSSANAERDQGFPHGSAFSQSEINALFRWIDGGGSLLLISDHPPFSPAAADLIAVLGAASVHTSTVAIPKNTDVFRRDNGTLRDHIILEGRHPGERVASVATFSGSAFYLSTHFQPLLVLGPEAYGLTYLRENLGSLPREELPRYDLAGWAQAATRHLGEGRVAILGEASMCTAQQDEYGPFGMNHPDAASNAQFCLNLVRWLSGVLVDPKDR